MVESVPRSRYTRWAWSKVSQIHRPEPGGPETSSCTGEIFSYSYRYHPPQSSSYERCVGLSWCSVCRSYTGAMVYIPRDRALWDALADLPDDERGRLYGGEVRLLDYLDRLVRRGRWQPAGRSQRS
jgi:hypothetical protein